MKKRFFFPMLIAAAVLTSCGGEEPTSEPAAETEEVQDTLPEQEASEPAAPPKNDAAARAARKEATEDNLMQLVLDLKEVQELDEEVRKKTNGKHTIKTMIASEPGDDQEYYAVTAAEDNGQALVTIYEFHIYPDMSVHYYDVVEDREMTLKEWRRKR